MKKGLLIILIFSLFVFLGCDNGSVSEEFTFTITPADGDINISKDISEIVFDFSEVMNGYWSVGWQNGLGVFLGDASWSLDVKTLTWPVNSQLDPGTTYTFILNPTGYVNMATVGGEYIPTDTSITFTTGN